MLDYTEFPLQQNLKYWPSRLPLWSNLSELPEVLSPGLQSSFCPQENLTCKKKKKKSVLKWYRVFKFFFFLYFLYCKRFIHLSYVITCIVILSFSYRSVIFSMYVSSVVWRRKWLPSPVFLPGESHEQRSLVGYSLWGCKESDRTEATSHAYMYTGSVVIHRLSMLMFWCVILFFPWLMQVYAY